MKKNIKELIILGFFCLVLFLILTNYSLVMQNIKDVTSLWLFKLFPSLFPFLVIGSILINYNFGYYFCRFFKLKNNSLVIFLLSLFSGFPSNAKFTKEMLTKNLITLEQATKVLGYSFFANPLFLISILTLTFPKRIAIFIILSHYLANFMMAFFTKDKTTQKLIYQKPETLGNIIAKSIKDGINTLLLILGTLTFYNIFITLFSTFIKNKFLLSLITGLLEFSQGLNSLINLSSSLLIKAFLATIFISFGSLSILTQIKSIIADTEINFLKFLKYRIFHVVIACLLLWCSRYFW